MFRLLACALGMALVLAVAGTARADEPIEETTVIEKRAQDPIVVVNREGEVVESTKPVTVRTTKLVLKDGKDGKRIELTAEDGKVIAVMHLTDGDMKVLSPKSGVYVSQADGQVVELDEDLEEEVEEIEEVIEESIRKLAPKTKVLVHELERLVDLLPVGEIANAFVDGTVMEDIEVTIKLPDGTTRTLSGKDAGKQASRLVRKFRYEPGELRDLLKKKMSGGKLPGNGGHLAARIKRLEEQNKRMQQELELMRRRMNEMMHARKLPARGAETDMPRLPKVFRDLAPARRKAPKSDGDSRLQRIEHLLEKLIKMQMGSHAKKRADADFPATMKKYFTVMKDETAGAREKAKKHAKKMKSKAPGKIHDMLEHSRARIEELQRMLEEQKAKLGDPK